MKKIIAIMLVLMIPLMQGCAVFAASGLGYLEADSKYTNLYNNYKQGQENAGQPAKEYKDWLKEQPLSRREIRIFKMYGVISEKEAKQIRIEEEMEKVSKPVVE